MSHDSRIYELAEIYRNNRRRFEQLEQYVTRKSNGHRTPGRRSRDNDENVIDLSRDIMTQLMSIKARIHRVTTSIRAMKKIADSLHSKYTMAITPVQFDHDTSIKDIIETKHAELRRQNELIDIAISKLVAAHDNLADKKTRLDDRIRELQAIAAAPIDDLRLIEGLVENMEMEDDALFLHVNQPEDVDINVDGIIVEQELRSKTQVRKMMIEKRRQEIRQEMEDLANRVYTVEREPVHLSIHSEEPSYNSEIVERYHCFEAKQEELDREEMELNERIAANTEERKRFEKSFEEKLATISSLTEATVARDQLLFQIHEMNDRTITLKETRLILSDNVKRLKRGAAVAEAMRRANEQALDDMVGLRERIERKRAEMERNDAALARKRQILLALREGVDALAEQYEERERMVEGLEVQEKDLENRCDQLSQEIKVEADQFDCLLFEASVSRADSRLQRLQALLDTKTESQQVLVMEEDESDSSDELTDLLRQATLVVQTPSKFEQHDSDEEL